jgi:hypothetical protein
MNTSHPRAVTRAKAEKFLRDNAKILVVGDPRVFAKGVSLDPLDPAKSYLLAILEVE